MVLSTVAHFMCHLSSLRPFRVVAVRAESDCSPPYLSAPTTRSLMLAVMHDFFAVECVWQQARSSCAQQDELQSTRCDKKLPDVR
jgi:hypothetical protein